MRRPVACSARAMYMACARRPVDARRSDRRVGVRAARWASAALLATSWPSDAVAASALSASSAAVRLRAVSWNVAAVNNNPFEYWITHPSEEYRQLMDSVERFIEEPGAEDVRVDEVFRPAMFEKVMERLGRAELPELETVRELWHDDYRVRRIVSQFLRDPEIGKKRLASMPDRVTNTIQLANGGAAFRPAVGNCYPHQIASLEDWFDKWLEFLFDSSVDVDGKGPKPVYTLLQKIKKSKYPAISEREETASVSLQVVVQGIFDAALVNLMLSKGGQMWQKLRREICESLNSRKNFRIAEILQTTYRDADVVFLQEAGNQLVDQLRHGFAGTHELVTPKAYSHKRSQNSVMLLRKGVIADAQEIDIPPDGWEAGDLLAVTAELAGVRFTFASFHGDTNGLLTKPMLARVMEHLPTEGLVFGMDANTYEKKSSSTAHVLEFERLYTSLGLEACGGAAVPSRYTTFNARTYLQPQLNKAAKSTELAEKGDRNPKDFILFSKHFTGHEVRRDNTGRGEFIDGMVFPTLDFPSDHAALSSELTFYPDGVPGRGTEL